jgi:hypothetical protein
MPFDGARSQPRLAAEYRLVPGPRALELVGLKKRFHDLGCPFGIVALVLLLSC